MLHVMLNDYTFPFFALPLFSLVSMSPRLFVQSLFFT
jgi:hypothetical protein